MSYLARRNRYAVNIWPGFVDALATLVLVFIFMLVVFVFAQFGLSDALNKRTSDVVDLESQITALNNDLTEQKRLNQDLQQTLQELEQRRLNQMDEFQQKLATLQNQRLRLELYADQLTQRLTQSHAGMAQANDQKVLLQGQLALAQRNIDGLNQRISSLSQHMAKRTTEADKLSTRLQTTQLQQRLLSYRLQSVRTEATEYKQRNETLQQTLAQSQSEARTIKNEQNNQLIQLERRLADLAKQNAALSNLLKKSAQQLSATNDQVNLLQNRLSEKQKADESAFSGYRSEFFTQLRELLGAHPDIRIVGDRFLFQSELLFGSGSADLGGGGKFQLNRVAETLLSIAQRIPEDVNWVLQVNGHTDKRPIRTSRFPSNWELSTERALSIVHYLINRGIPPQRLAATGFAEFDPIEADDNLQAYSRNRRIELKFTNR